MCVIPGADMEEMRKVRPPAWRVVSNNSSPLFPPAAAFFFVFVVQLLLVDDDDDGGVKDLNPSCNNSSTSSMDSK